MRLLSETLPASLTMSEGKEGSAFPLVYAAVANGIRRYRMSPISIAAPQFICGYIFKIEEPDIVVNGEGPEKQDSLVAEDIKK
jgi:hypothetical protein